MSKKVDFRNIVIHDVNGQEQKVDVRVMLGNLLYMQGQNIEECELGVAIYHSGKKGTEDSGEEGPEGIDLDDKQQKIITDFAARLPYVMRTGILAAIAK